MFDDLVEANRRFRDTFHGRDLPGRARRRLAVLTCIDSRIDPLAMLGLLPGDAKILRNAGARATADALRSLALSVSLLGVSRVCVVQHTDCAVVGATEVELRTRVASALGVTTGEWEFLAVPDQEVALQSDLEAIRACALIPATVAVGGFRYDVHTGELTLIATR